MLSLVRDKEVPVMQNVKQEAQNLLQGMPDTCTFEDIQYQLYVLEKVRRGMSRIETEGGISQEDAEKRLSKWIIK